MIPLSQLNAKFVGQLRPNNGEAVHFDCPVCGPSHTINAPFANPVDGGPALPRPEGVLWQRTGDSLEDLTLSPSIQYPCFHGWVEGGHVVGPGAVIVEVGTNNVIGALSPLQTAELKKRGQAS